MTIAKNPKRLTTEERQAGAFISGASKERRSNKKLTPRFAQEMIERIDKATAADQRTRTQAESFAGQQRINNA